jgi:hypothetical protein
MIDDKNIDKDFLYVTELYRNALKSMITNASSTNDYVTLSPLITNVEFGIAKEVIPELEEAYMKTDPASLGHKLCLCLLSSFALRKANEEDFVYVSKNSSIVIFSNTVANPYFPLEMLLDNNLYEKFRSDRLFDYLVDIRINTIRGDRYGEVMSYLKTISPDAEHMSDEMVFSVLGVKL